MRNLLEFLAKYYHWLLFVILEAASVVLLFSYNNYQSSVWFSSANTVSGKMYELTSKVDAFFALATVNEQLSSRNTELELELAEAKRRLVALSADSSVFSAELPIGYRTIAAKVVQSSVNDKDNLITINKGSADGVRADMGVVSGNGIVGIVYLVGKHYSVVIPVLNSHSSISCAIKDRGYYGYLHWIGGDSRYAYVEDVPRHAHFRNGDKIVTSGYSAVFPEGISIGKIICTFNSPDGLSYRLKIKLNTDFGNLRNVSIIDNTPMQEKLDILRAAQDSIARDQN